MGVGVDVGASLRDTSGNAVASAVSLFFRHLARALSDCWRLFDLTRAASSVRRPWVIQSPSTLKNSMIVERMRAH